MFLRPNLKKMALVLAVFFLSVSISEGAECNPCSKKAEAACPTAYETAMVASDSLNDLGVPYAPVNRAADGSVCTLCSFCLSPCMESSSMTFSGDDSRQRFSLPEYATYYEVPLLSFLRPPRN